ncbi:MAG TPA: RIP metalloprotease RseP [Anaeromyxobacteraceae bacterium]|jgi:regulator of sigma E protease
MSGLAGGLLVATVTVLAFALLIVVHELGHFAVARLCRMRVERFSIGFGPVLWSRRSGDTEWAVSSLPLGGYVRIAGMAPGEDVDPADAGAYCNQPAWRRFLVILAGPGMNYLAAVLLAAGLVLSLGFPEPEPGPVIGHPVPGGAAAAAGLRAGDRVLAVDGRPLTTWQDFVGEVVAHPGRPMRLGIERGGARIEVEATPRDEGGRGRLGVAQGTRLVRRAAPLEALARAFHATNDRAADVLGGLAQAVTGRQRAELRGPLGIAQEMARSARAGASPFLGMVWFISIVLALFNLLPLPALDGGRLVFLVYEIVARRRVNQRVETVVHFAGFVALLALVLAVTVFGDLARLFR